MTKQGKDGKIRPEFILDNNYIKKSKTSHWGLVILSRGLLAILKTLLVVKKILTWFFGRLFKTTYRFIVYRPLVRLYKIYLHLKRRTINYHQQSAWLMVIALLLIATFIAVNNWQESDRLVAAEDMVRDTWLSQMVGDDFSQLNELVVDYQSGTQLNLNQPHLVDNRLMILDSSGMEPSLAVGITTDRWAYNLSTVTLPSQDNPSVQLPSRRSITYYTVKIGDTLGGIAKSFGVSVNTIAWQNNISTKTLLRPGDKLTILPTSGVLHKVKAGDSLSKIAGQYKVDVSEIATYNDLDSDRVVIGQSLIIPGGQPPAPLASQVASVVTNLAPSVQQVFAKTITEEASSTGSMTWPTVGHRITQYYSVRHNGIDIANKVGTPIYAADGGRVEIAASGWNGGYGTTVLINHGKLKTRYGHLSKLYVKVGQAVEKGEAIGEMGSTGRSTGPHLHFEVLSGTVRYNPLNYVR